MKKIIAILIFTVMGSICFAGWIMDEICDGDKQTLIIGNGKIKIVQEDSVTIFDWRNERITLAATLLGSYWEGTLEELKRETGRGYDEDLKRLSKENKKEYNEIIKDSYKDSKDEKSEIKIKKGTENIKVAGFDTQKYEIYQNGKLKEEIWLAKDIKITKKNDLNGLKKIGAVIGEFSYENEFKYNNDAVELMKEGFPVKISALMSDYEESESRKFLSEIVRVEERKVEDEEFKVPSNFKRVKLSDIW